MSEEALYINDEQPTDDVLDYDFRVIVLEQSMDNRAEISIEQSEIEEILLDGIDTFTGINKFFDTFDTEIAYPNEKMIKYDVGSDGFIVIVVGSEDLKSKVLTFIESYLKENVKKKQPVEEEGTEDDNRNSKKAKK